MTKARILFVGGIDSSGAAGLAADMRAAAGLEVDAATVASAVTVQSTSRCDAVHPLDADILAAQMAAAARDVVPTVIKTGLLATSAQVRVVADTVRRWRAQGHSVDLIVDPVLAASSGATFFDAAAIETLTAELLPLANLATPNAEETRQLPDLSSTCLVLHKGGHAHARTVVDTIHDGMRVWSLSTPRRDGTWRGTGCSLAAAIAAARALGHDWLDAIVAGRSWLHGAVRRGAAAAHGPGRLSPMAWRDVTSDDVPDLWFGRRLDVRFVPLVAPIGVYPIVARAAEMPALVAAGVRTLQLRVKDLSGTALKNEIRAAVALAGSATQLFVNDYWREALELGAYGVHLGQEDLDTADLEAIAASGLRLGISTHSYAEAARAKSLSPSYIALGPIKPTTCKSMRFGPQGMPRIAEWRRLFAAPLVAIGGLKREDLTEVRALGADGAAVISGIVSAAAPGDAARAWIDTWISSRESD